MLGTSSTCKKNAPEIRRKKLNVANEFRERFPYFLNLDKSRLSSILHANSSKAL